MGADVLERVRERYRSFDSPWFGNVRPVAAKNPYLGVLRQIEKWFDCEEDTDPNDDFSFGYLLSDGSGLLVLRLSTIDRYAVLLRASRGSAPQVVSPGTVDASPKVQALLRLLADSGITVLDREFLEHAVPLRLHNAEPENVRLFQALFTDTDALPWETGSARWQRIGRLASRRQPA